MPATYDGIVKRLIRAYKFERLRAAYRPLAGVMVDTLPYFEDVIVTHIPTANSRIRQRGYDQAKLLAKEIARQKGWQYYPLLRRVHDMRQVGSSRPERMRQALRAFELKGRDVAGKHVLIVDDVTTSGATLLAAANLLSRAGCASIDAVVAAKHTLD